MLKAVRDMARRLSFVSGLVLVLIFAASAFESHACAAETLAATDGIVAVAALDHGESCPDCGPACAGVCCHAPHTAIAPDLSASGTHDVERPTFWSYQEALTAVRPSGPDRPPRF